MAWNDNIPNLEDQAPQKDTQWVTGDPTRPGHHLAMGMAHIMKETPAHWVEREDQIARSSLKQSIRRVLTQT